MKNFVLGSLLYLTSLNLFWVGSWKMWFQWKLSCQIGLGLWISTDGLSKKRNCCLLQLKFGFLSAFLGLLIFHSDYGQIKEWSLQLDNNCQPTFWNYSHISFLSIGPFLLVLVSVELLGGFGSGSKASFGPTNVDYQLWFWKYINIFLFLLQAHLGSSLLFSTLHLYWELLMKNVVTAQPQPQHSKKLGETR